KSACTGSSSPIERMISAEFAATGRSSTRWFHGFDAGKTGQPAIVGCCCPPPAPVTRATTAANTGSLERIEHRVPPRGGLEQPEEQEPGGGVGRRDSELRPQEPCDLAEAAARCDRAGGLDPVGERQAAADRAHPPRQHRQRDVHAAEEQHEEVREVRGEEE